MPPTDVDVMEHATLLFPRKFGRVGLCADEEEMKYSLVMEFLRYAVVGGVAFAADFGSLVAAQELLFKSFSWGVYASTVVGFVVGLAVNYCLSLRFVFTQEKDLGKGRSFGAFVVFGLIGIVGLGLTELGMWVGVEILGWNYMVVKFLVTGAVLVWNYLGRKVLVFGGKESAK